MARLSFLDSTFAFLLLHSLANHALVQAQSGPSNSSLAACLDQSGVTVSLETRNSSTWANETAAWQKRIQPDPAGVVYPTTADEVAASLQCAREAGIKVAALGGGHSYGSYGLGGNDGRLVINMKNFQNTTYDPTTGLFTYGGGIRVGPAATWLWDNHGVTFPHVRANWVGLAGSSIGGGFGSLSRFLGTPMDYLESVEYMLYNGTVVSCSRTENSDLFWAAQGAGSSFGILLSLTTKTWKPVHQSVTNFTISLGNASIETGVKALLTIQDYALSGECPDELSLRWQLTAPPFEGSGFYYGDPQEFESKISPLMQKLPASATITTAVADFWTMENVATPGLNTTVETYPARNFYLQALVLRTDAPFTYESAFALYNSTTYAFNRTDMTKFGFIDLWGGVSRDIKDTDTSFAHANSLWLIRWEGRLASGLQQWPADGISYLRSQMKPFENQLATEGVPLRGFVNYRDTALTEKEWSSRLYGENYGRLKAIRATVDPDGLFMANDQSIP